MPWSDIQYSKLKKFQSSAVNGTIYFQGLSSPLHSIWESRFQNTFFAYFQRCYSGCCLINPSTDWARKPVYAVGSLIWQKKHSLNWVQVISSFPRAKQGSSGTAGQSNQSLKQKMGKMLFLYLSLDEKLRCKF